MYQFSLLQKKIILVPYFDSNGSVNQLDLSTVTGPGYLDDAFFSALVNQADGSKRWFPLPEMKNIKDERGDDLYESFDDQTKMFINQGIRAFSGLILRKDASPILLGKLKAARCVPVGIYIIDKDGNLIGSESQEGYLAPIRVEEDTFSVKWVKTGDKNVQAINLAFEFHIDENDEDLRMISSQEMTANLNLLKGLLDVRVVYSGISVTGVTAKLTTDFGTLLNPVEVEGLLVSDVAARNVTTSASISLTGTGSSFTESAPGVYNIVYKTTDDPATTNVVKLTFTKAGFDFSEVNSTTFVTP